MTPDNLRELYVQQLRDVYSAETQLIDALPAMVEAAASERLKDAFRTHLRETERQKVRLEQLFDRMDMSPRGQTCHAMKGLIKDANGLIKDAKNLLGHDAPPEVLDAGLIAQAQRVEHFEISAYGTLAAYAERLGRTDDHRLLTETLGEEKHTDELLTGIARDSVNPAAAVA